MSGGHVGEGPDGVVRRVISPTPILQLATGASIHIGIWGQSRENHLSPDFKHCRQVEAKQVFPWAEHLDDVISFATKFVTSITVTVQKAFDEIGIITVVIGTRTLYGTSS